jgi:hypothetical protein
LDKDGKAIDDDLEEVNFSHEGKVLTEIWSGVSIDGFPIVAEYIEPENS